MKPIVIILSSDRHQRLGVKNALDPVAEVVAGESLNDLIPEIKWTEIGAVLLDTTDTTIDSYQILEVINTTHPSIPVLCLVNSLESVEALEFKHESSKNSLLNKQVEPGQIADILMDLIGSNGTTSTTAAKNGEMSTPAFPTSNARHAFANQMQRFQGNLRRVEEYIWGEITGAVRGDQLNWSEVEWLESVNIGLEGFLQIQIEQREKK